MVDGAIPAEKPKVYAFQDRAGLTRWLIWILWGTIGANAVGLFAAATQYALLSGFHAGSIDRQTLLLYGTPNDSLMLATYVLTTVGIFASLITFLFWIYRISANVHALGAKGLSASPGLSVGFFFIPFANLVMVPTVVGQLWRASRDPAGWDKLPFPAWVGVWWGFSLSANLYGLVMSFATADQKGIGAMISATALLVGLRLLDVIYHFAQLQIVRTVAGFQRKQALLQGFS